MSSITQTFFDRPVLNVAPELLGKYLVSANGTAKMITETEAYDGPDDKACHAWKGRTARTDVMFGPAGRWYVYVCYGMHWMLNIVTGYEGYPSAVLIRGVEDAIGPGRVTKHFGIDKRFNACQSAQSTGLWIEDRGVVIKPEMMKIGPRIGVDYAKEWAAKPYRFWIHQKS